MKIGVNVLSMPLQARPCLYNEIDTPNPDDTPKNELILVESEAESPTTTRVDNCNQTPTSLSKSTRMET
ncbi:hypothetical protein WG66_002409 [Moniliophthora roreri]|nr:hypothetical protein WG66_002409 [Moniliophthora roreri]